MFDFLKPQSRYVVNLKAENPDELLLMVKRAYEYMEQTRRDNTKELIDRVVESIHEKQKPVFQELKDRISKLEEQDNA